jgi:hypothetical protein
MASTGDDKRAEIVKRNRSPSSSEKRDRSAFLYMEPDPDIKDFAQCGSCMHFIPDEGRCFWLSDKDEVDADDSCGFYAQGKPAGGKPSGQYTPETLGFYEGKVRCENCDGYDDRDKDHIHCDVYVQLTRMLPHIWKLDEKVKPHACCNAYANGKRDPKNFGPYGPIPDPDDPHVGGLISKMVSKRK